MKKFLAVMLLVAGFFVAAIPLQAESAMPVGKYKCRNCGLIVESKYDVQTNKIPVPSKKGCPKSSTGEHNWWALGTSMR